MKKALSQEHVDILKALAAKPEPMDFEAVSSAITFPITTRTLHRRLGELVEAGHIQKTGSARATRYQITPAPVAETQQGATEYETYIPLSPASREILAYVRMPLQARHPVNYERTMLDNYVPNETFYIDEATRGHLRRIGDTGEGDQPIGTYGRAILDRLLIDLSWSSSKLEGNTYTRLDTEKLIQQGQEAEGKKAQDAQMILNHKRAIELIVDDIESVGFNRFTFLNLHGLLAENLLADQTACGRVRIRGVDISGTVYKPCDIPQVLDDMFNQIMRKASEIRDPFEQAFFVLVHIPYLQPFEDVNKRVSRIGANIAFIKNNLCPLTFLDVSERAYIDGLLGIYELGRFDLYRDMFVWAYERSTQKYLQVKNAVEEPDRIRLEYRTELHALVGHVVRDKIIPYEKHVTSYASKNIKKSEDRSSFIATANDDIKRIHEGVLVRYKLAQSDLNEWKNSLRQNK